jgi:ribosome-binding protein aMBF1 (putative translation factor)
MTQVENKAEWYNNKALLIILFFVFPPLGIYAMIKHKTDVWKKILYILPSSFFSILFVSTIIVAFSFDSYKTGLDYYNKKEYVKAYDNFQLVSSNDKNYKDAISKIAELKPIVDSIKKSETSKENLDINKEGKSEEKVKNDTKSQIERELIAIDKGITIGKGENITALQMDLVLLSAYSTIIKEGENSDDEETKKLAKKLKEKVQSLQKSGFPKLRQRYTEIVKGLMWENDIDVYSSDGGKVLNLTGGIFASNKNIKQVQETINENMQFFRFKQVRYRWYKGSDEFTYYDVNPPKDTEPVTFEN